MQTFLPYPDYYKSLRVLDNQRLGKQRVEALQIVRALTPDLHPNYGWQNHPAVEMWRTYERSLIWYGIAACDIWVSRGYKDTVRTQLWVYLSHHRTGTKPYWLGDKEFHKSHKSNLVRKDPAHYRQYFPNVRDDLPYIWPAPRT